MESQQEFITHKPKSEFLQQFISYYYFHTLTEKGVEANFRYYPGYKNALTIYKNSSVTYGQGYSEVVPDSNSGYIFLYSGIQPEVRTAYITGPFQKIGIVFHELGINHFIDEDLNKLSSDPIEKSFSYFGDDLKQQCDAIYNKSDIDEKVDLLDAFFVNRYIGFDETLVKQCVKEIIHSSEKQTVSNLAEKFQVSRKTLLRTFQKHLCCSVKEYIDVVQFRNVLYDYLLQKKDDSLTGVALDNDYYDQSQFINHFKKFSGINPTKFFKHVEHVGQEALFWTFH